MKSLVINGLTRGGTNLVANYLAAQKDVYSTDISLLEFLAYSDLLPVDIFGRVREITLQELIAITDMNREWFKEYCVDIAIRYMNPTFHGIQTAYHREIGRYYGVDTASLFRYFTEFSRIDNILGVDAVYRNFAHDVGREVLAHRCVGMTAVARTFLGRNDSNYWIEVTRDPFDRYYSSSRGHALIASQSFHSSRWQRDHILSSHERYKVISYEFFCQHTKEVCQELSDWLGVSVDMVNPVTPDMQPFAGNSSESKQLFDQSQGKSGVYVSSIGRLEEMSASERRIGNRIMSSATKFSFDAFLFVLFRTLLLFPRALMFLLSSLYFILRYAGKTRSDRKREWDRANGALRIGRW